MTEQHTKPLRIVLFHNLAPAYALCRSWAAEHGHKVVLVVTSPGPLTRRTEAYRGVLAGAPPDQEVLVTTRPRTVATPLVRALAPDLVLSMTFPFRLPPELLAIPRLGAVNLHPTLLPAYRGPNPFRAVYEEAAEIGATLHRMDADFDTGNILYQYGAPLPQYPTPETFLPLWMGCMKAALEEGLVRALAGEPGSPQNETGASYGAAFSEVEQQLDWSLPVRTLARRTTALNAFTPSARALIEGKPYNIKRLVPDPSPLTTVPAGTCIARTGDQFVIRAGDGNVLVVVEDS